MTDIKLTRRALIGSSVGVATAVAAGDNLVDGARAQSAPRTFLLIHGAWVGGWYWRRVSDLLEKKGHKVFSPTLTGLGERSHLLSKDINLDTHVTDIVNVIKWEDLRDVCMVAHSYGGWIGSGALEQIGDRVSSIVWLDAFKPKNGQRPLDLTGDTFRQAIRASSEKGQQGFPPPAGNPVPIFVNESDSAYVTSKVTLQPIGTYLQPIKLSGARNKAAKKTYIRATKYPSPVFDKALAECKADKSWSTSEIDSGHLVMLDAPEWLADHLLQAA
jgi:pimeloyl-ACP methyl ester carboxylesterase